MKSILVFTLFLPVFLFGQVLTNSSNLDISKTWSQEPGGWTYNIDISVPSEEAPSNGFPVCILLHGNNGTGAQFLNDLLPTIPCHILLSPSGYMKSWNICDEDSDAPDMEMIDDLINSLATFTNVDTSKIRFLGFSNGSSLANRIFVENNNPNIDKICTVVSQLTDMQSHNQNFYGPSGETDPSLPFCGYDDIKTPTTGRHYLNICNTNDPIIPYEGGPAVGAIFVPSKDAIYEVAKSQGYTGSKIEGDGEEINSTGVFEYSYLSNQVVHLRGDAEHGLNETQKNYICNFFSCNCPPTGTLENNNDEISIFPNPVNNILTIRGINEPTAITVLDVRGRIVINEQLSIGNINVSNLISGIYCAKIKTNHGIITKEFIKQ